MSPEPGTLQDSASCRVPSGKPIRNRFRKDGTKSELAYHRCIVKDYDQSWGIIASDRAAGKANSNQSSM